MISPLIQMAVRNVGRNKRRTLITVLTVVIGTTVVIQVRGLINGLQAEMIRNLTRKVNGDLQFHRAGYADNLDANPFAYLLPFTPQRDSDLRAQSGVQSAAPRLRVFGILNNQRTQKTTPVFLTGIDPKREVEVCPRVLDGIQEGRFLQSAPDGASEAVAPRPSPAGDLDEAPELDPAALRAAAAKAKTQPRAGAGRAQHDILLTPPLARGLQAKIGDELVLLMKDANNMEQALVGRLVGTLDMNLPMTAAKMAWLDVSVLQKTLHVPDQASEIVLRTREGTNLRAVQKALARSEGENVAVERWDEVAGFFSDVMGLQNAVFKVVLAIMFVIVSSAIINTSMMTVSERVREIGTLMAIGYKRRHILTIFLVESTTIGLLGGLSGVAIGLSAVGLVGRFGLKFSFPGTKAPFMIQPFVTADFVFLVLFLASVSALLAGLYPSYRASRMSPVKALSSN